MIKKALISIAGILCLILLYFTAALVGHFISLRGETLEQEYPIYVSSGDIHTEFVFELERSPFDWRKFIDPDLVYKGDKSELRYISLGQGDKRFFYEFLRPSDLTIELAFNGAFIPSQTAIHVDYNKQFSSTLRYYRFTLNKERYLALVDFIKSSFQLENERPIKIDEFNYYGTDGFFWGSEKYHLFNTCNMWTARGLEVANLPRPLWAPFRYSIDRALENFLILSND